MPLDLPSWARAWLQARRSGEALIEALTLYHPMIETFRMVKNPLPITSRGNVYNASWFTLAILNDNDQPPRASISLVHTGTKIVHELRKLVNPPYLTLEVLNAAHLDEPVYRAAWLELHQIRVEGNVLTGDLIRHNYAGESFGKIFVSETRFPSLFRRKIK